MKLKQLLPLAAIVALASCNPHDLPNPHEDASTFTEISSTVIGAEGAAEISAFDPQTKKLFVVTNTGVTQIDILDLSNPAAPVPAGFIDISPYGGGVNSVAVYNGKLAAAVEGFNKTDDGKVVVFKTTDYAVVKQVTVGVLPDMVTYTYDGKYILTANEGEPNADYSYDPVGSVSIIAVNQNYSATTLDFSSFAGQVNTLKAKGLRLFGPGASFAQDMEPEYVAVSKNSTTAWVTLQENNAIAEINIPARRITKIMPLGFKDYNITKNAIDGSDRDGGIIQKNWPVKGMYLPDAIAVVEDKGIPFLFTANEGDAREYTGFLEEQRVKDVVLDETAFPNGAVIRTDANAGRLKITNTMGDTNNDGDYDVLYSFGARSFSVWNGNNGQQLFDSDNELEDKCIAAGYYDDTRSDDKGVEPEGVTLGYVGNKAIAFVGMERSNAVAIYNINNPAQPSFIKLLRTGIGPEGLLFIPAKDSPSGKSLLVVSSEVDGTVKIYQTN